MHGDCLEHVPDEILPGLLQSVHDALRPGGVLFAAEAAASQPEPQVETRPIGERRYPVVERRRTAAEVAAARSRAWAVTSASAVSDDSWV